MSKLLSFLLSILLLASTSVQAEIFDCTFIGELHYGALIPSNDPNELPTVELRVTQIVPQEFVINLSGFIPQDKKIIIPQFRNGLRLGVYQDFQFKLLMIQDHGSGNILSYFSIFREDLMGTTSTTFATSRLAISVLNDHFATGVNMKPYWFKTNQHDEAEVVASVSCLLQDIHDPSTREDINENVSQKN